MQLQVEPKKGLKKGTPDGDKMLRVRVMKPCTYGPTAALERLYEVGEELTIPAWRFTSWHEPDQILDRKGKPCLTVRGTFELADRPRPIDDNVAKHPDNVRELMDQNDELRRRLAIFESGGGAVAAPAGKNAKKEEI